MHTDCDILTGDDNASKFYGYVPTLYICIIFLSLFVISTGEFLKTMPFESGSSIRSFAHRTSDILPQMVLADHSRPLQHNRVHRMGRPHMVSLGTSELDTVSHTVRICPGKRLPVTTVISGL